MPSKRERMDLEDLLGSADGDVAAVFERNPAVHDRNDLVADELPDAAGETWFRIDDAVAVFCDLQASTQLGLHRHQVSTAAIYRAAMKNCVKILNEFDADFIQLQGDGAFGLFWGARSVERAMCSGITVRTFSEASLEPRLKRKWPDAPATGFKVGIASGRVLVKKVGTPRNPAEQEPIWAGKPVNYAAKAAQQASRGELIVTASVWAQIEDNDFLTIACNHDADKQDIEGTPAAELWEDVEIKKFRTDSPERRGRLLTSTWCEACGPGFVKSILAGKKDRHGWDVHNARLYRWLLDGLGSDEVTRLDRERLDRLVEQGLLRISKRR